MRGVWCFFVGLGALATLAGCKSSWFAEREPWRRQAEEQCLKSGAVKESPAIAMLRPIQGPGICGADFPLKVVALGEGGDALGYAQELRPPGSVPQVAPAPSSSSMPYPRGGVTSTPLSSPAPQSYPSYSPPPSYSRPSYDVAPAPSARGGQSPLSLDPAQGGPNSPTYYPSVDRAPIDPLRGDGSYARPYEQRPYDPPRSSDIVREEPDEAFGDDDPRDANPRQSYPRAGAQRQSYPPNGRADAPHTTAPAPSPRLGTVPPLGPARRPIQTTAAVSPAATLACPIVSALDAWIKDSVQPSAQRWFNQPVVEIRQISAYSCRGMNGQPGARISEHAFGNALDIASFVLADGRKVTVKGGWRGSPEEQGFLRDIQAAACDQFTTVLAPGSNAFHYDHIHVDLMRRSSGRRICQPGAVSGEEVAARAARNGKAFAHQQDRYQPASPPRRDRELVDPNNDPFAWRGPNNRRDALPTGSISKSATNRATKPPKPPKAPWRSDPVDDEHILEED